MITLLNAASGPLFDSQTKHQPGYAVPRKFSHGDITFELDVLAPPKFAPDLGWALLLMANCPGATPYLSRWTGASRPTAAMEKLFLQKAIQGTLRFYANLRAGVDPAQAVMRAHAHQRGIRG